MTLPLWADRIKWAYQDGQMRARFSEWAVMQAAWWVPRRLAYWCFIRVYASWGECGPDFPKVCAAWERQR